MRLFSWSFLCARNHSKCYDKSKTKIVGVLMKKNLYIAIGGMLGASLRYCIKTEMDVSFSQLFPIQTLFANILGCFLIAVVLTAAIEYLEIDVDLRLGIATGFLGALTTFSTLCKEAYMLIESGQWFTSLLYIFISLATGMFAVYGGVLMTRYIFKRRLKAGEE